MLANASQVSSRCFADPVPTFLGELREYDAGVGGVAETVDQPFIGQTVDHAREPAGREHDPLSKLSHSQLAVRGPCQPDENVVLTQAQSVLVAQFGVELTEDLLVSVKECLPGLQLGIGKFLGHAGK